MKSIRNGRAGMAAVVGMCVMLGAACAGDDAGDAMVDTSTATTPATAVGAGDSAGAGMMSDGQIVQQVTLSNSAEIASSQLAADKATNADVKQFAQRMVDEHQAAQGQVDSLAVRLGIAAQDQAPDSAAQALEQRRAALQGMSGADFDREYMAMQVEMHQATLDLLNRSVAATQNADLKSTLQTMIPAVQSHLDQARQIQGQLGQATGS